MPDAPLMLGVSGLRGIVGKSLTPEVAARFAEAFAAWLQESEPGRRGPLGIVVARDGRRGGEDLYQTVTEAIMRSGCNVIDLEVAMTPTAGVAVDCLRAAGAMIVTASHNPQEWNGLKLLVRPVDGGSHAPGPAIADEIIARFRDAPAGATAPAVQVGHASSGIAVAKSVHMRLVLEGLRELGVEVPLLQPPKVVLDSVNGSGIVPGDVLMSLLRCQFQHLGKDTRTGIFPHPPEPTRENLTSLCGAVKYFSADIGFAQDPDADRLAIVDERGEYIGEEYTLALAAESLLTGLKARPPKGIDRVLVTNLSTSRMLDDIAAAHGARVVRTPVGEANVVEAMKREKAAGHEVVLGGEGNGGVIWPKVTYVRDSLSAMALVLALMARTGKKVSELVAAIPAYAIEKRKVDLARKEDARPAIEKLAAAYKSRGQVDLQDGIRIDWPDRRAWLHVRASNTEPIMRLIAEAPDAADSRAILDDASQILAG
jgi:phosphomannomutase